MSVDSRDGRTWKVAAAVVLVAGLATSAVAGQWWWAQVGGQRQAAFDEKVDAAAATVASMLRRYADVADSALALRELSPDLTGVDFQRWFDRVAASGRYSGIHLVGMTEKVAAADAPAVLAGVLADWQARFESAPPEERSKLEAVAMDVTLDPAKSTYCLGTAMAGRLDSPALDRPPAYNRLDQCESPVNATLERARDRAAPVASTWGAPNFIGIAVPHYGGGAAPATLAERREAFTGVMGLVVDGRELLQSARGREDVWLELARVQPSGTVEVVATSAARPGSSEFTRTVSLAADGPWQLRAAGAAPIGGYAPDAQRLGVFALGALSSILVFALVTVLGRGRERALRLVDERTRELRHLAMHDPLTQLPNRALITDRAEHLIQRARRGDVACAALFIDLDGFKDINDTLGHEAGDRLLEAVADRLRGALRECDTVGRMGGDEFVVLLEGDAATPAPEVVATRILDVLRQPFRLTGGDTLHALSASVGVAIGGAATGAELIRNADVALYRAKAAGRDRFVVFETQMQEAVQHRLDLATELRAAIQRDELYLEYQPTFRIETKDVKGVEALVRWAHPVRGVVPPLEFIPFAEENGLVVDIGTWVLRRACRQMAQWHAEGYDLDINVNVSARQLERPDFVALVAEAVRNAGLRPDALVLEITESTLATDPGAIASTLGELKRLGVKVAIDDFGTGYSSLSYLRQFPVDAIKIDRSFVAELGRSPEASTLMHSLIQLGKNLGLETLAEGVEDEIQMEYLRREHCDAGQGFVFSRPLGVDTARAFFAGAVSVTAATP